MLRSVEKVTWLLAGLLEGGTGIGLEGVAWGGNRCADIRDGAGGVSEVELGRGAGNNRCGAMKVTMVSCNHAGTTEWHSLRGTVGAYGENTIASIT